MCLRYDLWPWPLVGLDISFWRICRVGSPELELELIQTHMTQKPMLRVEVGARALRELIKNCGWTGRASAGVQGTRVWAWIQQHAGGLYIIV